MLLCFNCPYAQVPFVHNFHDFDYVDAESCMRDVIRDIWLFIIGCAICSIKYCVYGLH